MIDIERLVREALQRHETDVPMPDPRETHPVAVRARRRQVLNVLGAGVVALLIALGAVGGIGSLLRTDGRRPAIEPTPTRTRPGAQLLSPPVSRQNMTPHSSPP